MWNGSFLGFLGITSKRPPCFHESRLKGCFLMRYYTINNFFLNPNHWTILDPPPRNDPIFFGRRFLKVCPLNKGYSNPFARPSYLQPKLPPVGQAQGKLRRFRGSSVNFVVFEERMEYPLGNDHVSPPSKGTFLESMMFRISVWWDMWWFFWRVSDMTLVNC